jgi:histidinol phosphatase-like enzyme
MIGDSQRDVEAGEAAGCKQSFLIEKNKKQALADIVQHICQSSTTC